MVSLCIEKGHTYLGSGHGATIPLPGAQMVMTDVSNTQERAGALGKLGVSYGVGMVVGPTVGGYVTTQRSEQFAAGVAAFLCVLTMVIIVMFVPANTKAMARGTKENKKQGERGGEGLRSELCVHFRVGQCV